MDHTDIDVFMSDYRSPPVGRSLEDLPTELIGMIAENLDKESLSILQALGSRTILQAIDHALVSTFSPYPKLDLSLACTLSHSKVLVNESLTTLLRPKRSFPAEDVKPLSRASNVSRPCPVYGFPTVFAHSRYTLSWNVGYRRACDTVQAWTQRNRLALEPRSANLTCETCSVLSFGVYRI